MGGVLLSKLDSAHLLPCRILAPDLFFCIYFLLILVVEFFVVLCLNQLMGKCRRKRRL